MEISMHFFLACLVFLVFVFYTWKAMNFAYFRPKKLEGFLRKQGFKGNRFNFLYGDVKEMLQFFEASKTKPINLNDDIKPRAVGFFNKTITTYGKKCFAWIGPTPALILNDPEIVKDIFNKTDAFGRGQPMNPFIRLIVTGLFTYDGEKWTKHRKILSRAFHFEKIKLMIPAFKLSCDEVLNKWEELISRDGFGEIDVCPYLQTITSDAISRTAFGSSYEEGRRIFELQKEQAENVIRASKSVYIPGSRFLPTKTNRRMTEVAREVKSLIQGLVDRRMRAIGAGEVINRDLLTLMLESNIREMKERGNKTFGMSTDDIIDECKLFYFAGQETSSVLLSWTMVLLSRHPEWQDRAREEVLNAFGTKNAPDYDGLSRLKVVTMIFYEVMRLYPPVTDLWRRVKKDIKMGNDNMTLPSGVDVMLPVIFLHHDSEIWGEDALEFKPERFKDGVAKAQKVAGGLYFPFGYGPRICIGQMFAMLEAKLVISMILQNFSFRLSPSYVHAPLTSIIMEPQYGAPLILHKLHH